MDGEPIDISGAGFSQTGPPSDDFNQTPKDTQPHVQWDPSTQATAWGVKTKTHEDVRSSTSDGDRVGASIAAQLAANNAPKERLEQAISTFNTYFSHGRGFCSVCFFLSGAVNGELETHLTFAACAEASREISQKKIEMYDAGYRSWKRTHLTFPGDHKYCFFCGSSQEKGHNKLEPQLHIEWGKTGAQRRDCPWAGLICKAVYAAWFYPGLLDELRLQRFPFPENIMRMSLDEYGDWIIREERDRFWNGLEMFIFRLNKAGWS